VRDAREDCRVVDLVAVELKDRQDCAVAHGAQELVGVPGGGERAGLRLAIAHHDRDQEVWVVKGGAEGVGKRVSELAALVNRARGFWGTVAANAAGE
jgi:hypothetical protein